MVEKSTKKRADRIQGIAANGIRICIDACGNDLEGRIYSRMSREPILFKNCSEMFLKTDKLFNERNYPQAFQEKRSFFSAKATEDSEFEPPQVFMDEEEIFSKKGKYSTFDVIIRSRRNAGWQGIIKVPDSGEIVEYQSEMELLEYLSNQAR